MKAEQAWQAALGQLQIEMPKAAYDTWVRDAQFISYEDGLFIIGVQNAYARDWLDSRLLSTIKRMLTGIMNRSVQVRFIVWNGNGNHRSEEPLQDAMPLLAQPEPVYCSTLNQRYTFENFIVGANNRLAHAASLAVAEKPAHIYNPLFLYGGVGLGKTHLLHAIGNLCAKRGCQVLYVSSEEFTNDLVNAIRTQTTHAFREKYRRIEVLLIDDIHFIAGKESTQEEFFHTFNTLHGQDKQVVISSDRSPKALVTLEERLRSRFEWGLIVDIQPPDYETRLAILHSKAERSGYHVPDDILEIIARRVQSNIRELEGALTRVVAYADLSGMPITPQLVDTAMADLVGERKQIEPEEIVRLVSETFGVSVERIISKDRAREVALPRQIAMYLMREELKISLPQIGEVLGGRDHTTIMHGCEKVAELLQTDDRLSRRVMELRERMVQKHRSFAAH
jgi:chromosomal replication initiator protein